ncbi:hypothetical protein DGWBC_1478 [Dehalogenimonas sp. WBC-2]|nr:hypothetical protein DGWBC_1478 [Dehalogenimonas sp. WBC-2]
MNPADLLLFSPKIIKQLKQPTCLRLKTAIFGGCFQKKQINQILF